MKESALSFSCGCGAVEGACRDAGGNMGARVICYCADCQAFAFFLGRENDYLDAAGGTDIYQTAPSRLSIVKGIEHVRRVAVTPKGMHRFYADCCKTPLANTIASRQLPFAGTFVANYDPARREAAFGPPISAVFTTGAVGEPVETARRPLPLLVLDLMRRALQEWLGGASHRNVYLDAADKGVIGPVQILSAEERKRLDAKAADRGRRP